MDTTIARVACIEAAKVIVRERKGEFPHTAEDWRELPGIGTLHFGGHCQHRLRRSGRCRRWQRRARDGAVVWPCRDRELAWQRAEAVLDRARPGDFNQAMMELGATVCTPRAPQCLVCPLITWCATRGVEIAKPQAARKRQKVHYALARKNNLILLVQRHCDSKRMAAMWELPEVAPSTNEKPLAKFRHSITDTDYEVFVVAAPFALAKSLKSQGRWCNSKQWQKMALTGVARKVLSKLGAAT